MIEDRRRTIELAKWLAGLAPDARERFEERAAIMEFDGEISRADAEWKAMRLQREGETP